MITIRDVTKLLQLKSIESENKFFTQLTATVTHEMMILLNCIITFARSIAKQNFDQRSRAKTIENVAILLKMNLKDLLDRSLLQNGKLQTNFEEASLYDLVDEVLMIMQAQTELKQIIRIIDIGAVQGEKYMLDVQRTMQILINLISNATKFSQIGGIVKINVETKKVDGQLTNILIHVIDQGIGMTKEQI